MFELEYSRVLINRARNTGLQGTNSTHLSSCLALECYPRINQVFKLG